MPSQAKVGADTNTPAHEKGIEPERNARSAQRVAEVSRLRARVRRKLSSMTGARNSIRAIFESNSGRRSQDKACPAPRTLAPSRIVKTLALEDIYADPHKLDSFLDSGESVEVVRDGLAVAEWVPRKAVAESGGTSKWPPIDFRARFLKMWGPDAFRSQVPVTDLFDELRRQREL